MKYIPEFSEQEVKENHRLYEQRLALYRTKGLDFSKLRELILGKVLPLQDSTLEVGTGKGHTTLALAKAGCEFISIDTDKEALKITALNLAYENVLSRVTFYLMDGTRLEFKDGSFQNVIIVNMFHHIKEIGKVLSEVDRVLRHGGKIILADLNRNGLKLIDSVHNNEGRHHENYGASREHINFYFKNLGYNIDITEDKHHWLLIGKKTKR